MKTQDIKNIARAMQQVQEKLKGDQHKLDTDNDGDIDAADFKNLRKKKKSSKEDEVEINPKKGDTDAQTAMQNEDDSYYTHQVAQHLAKKDGHDYHSLPVFHRGVGQPHQQGYDQKAKDALSRGEYKHGIHDSIKKESVELDEISKNMAGRYLKKVPASSADAGDKTGRGGMGQAGASPDVKKDYEKQRKSGINQFLKRQRGTKMAVDKLTGKAKVPATESVEVDEKTLTSKDIKKALASIKPPKKKPTLPKAPWDKEDNMKEDTVIWPVYSRILENRAAHYKGAAAPETSDDKLKGAGAKKMKDDFAGNAADPDLEKKGHDDAAKAGRAGPNGKKRSNDNSNGDKTMQKLAAAYGKVVSEK